MDVPVIASISVNLNSKHITYDYWYTGDHWDIHLIVVSKSNNRIHAHIQAPAKITFPDFSDYSEHTEGDIFFFHENIAYLARKQKIENCSITFGRSRNMNFHLL